MFHELQHPNPRTYQYAARDLSFADFSKTPCPACGRERAEAVLRGPHHLLTEGGPRYPDFLPFCGAGGPMLVLSRRAVTVFLENGITGIGEAAPIRVTRADGTMPEAAPEYCLVTVTGRIGPDLPQMCLKKKKVCPICGGFEWNRRRMPRLVPDIQTWDGSDLCRVSDIPGYVVCTSAVAALVKQYKLKGFAFQALYNGGHF